MADRFMLNKLLNPDMKHRTLGPHLGEVDSEGHLVEVEGVGEEEGEVEEDPEGEWVMDTWTEGWNFSLSSIRKYSTLRMKVLLHDTRENKY